MSDQDTIPSHVHPECALLPWYVNGTLDGSDREQVDRHLANCPTCRTELEDLTALKGRLTTFYNAQPGPSTHASRHVLDRVTLETDRHSHQPAERTSWLGNIDEWLRTLLINRWVPTLAATLFLVQIGLTFWISMPTPATEQLTTRSLGMPTAMIVVSFQRTATEEQIRDLLQRIYGRVADGPTADGRYTIQVPAADPSAVQRKLDLLRGQPEIVRSADEARP